MRTPHDQHLMTPGVSILLHELTQQYARRTHCHLLLTVRSTPDHLEVSTSSDHPQHAAHMAHLLTYWWPKQAHRHHGRIRIDGGQS